MIVPSSCFFGSKRFNKKWRRDRRITKLYDFIDGDIVFDNILIEGGVCVFLWEKYNNEPCEVHALIDGEELTAKRYLDDDGDCYIRIPEMASVRRKVMSGEVMSKLVSPSSPYWIVTSAISRMKEYADAHLYIHPRKNGYRLLGIDEHRRRVWRYLNEDYRPPRASPSLYKYKVFVTKAYGRGPLGQVLADPILGKPKDLCTQSFVEIGAFDTEYEARALLKYIRTKFFRALVSAAKQYRNAHRQVYRFVPVQDFTPDSDLNWALPLDKLDKMLYKKYGLSDDEIAFIEKYISPVTPYRCTGIFENGG